MKCIYEGCVNTAITKEGFCGTCLANIQENIGEEKLKLVKSKKYKIKGRQSDFNHQYGNYYVPKDTLAVFEQYERIFHAKKKTR